MRKTGITPTRKENYSEWYQQVIRAADLAENSSVRGCMVIKPWGYGIWEVLQSKLDRKFKETGHENAYFPLFIPVSYLEKEAKHVEGFAKECAVVTHSRLEVDENGKLIPSSPLDEPLIVRPTSETIIGESFSKWIKSYRDLPILINQWANVVRWEMRTRMFLRTSEFLWQEGHTAHATAAEARAETLKMLEIYKNIAENELAIPVIVGEKPESEKFPGAESTYALEAIMQDGKALQLGTSHFLGQNFSRAMNIEFVNEAGEKEFAWTTSWGVTTRLIGAIIMTHSDDDGLVLPPRIANLHAVVLPVVHDESRRAQVEEYCDRLKDLINDQCFADAKVKAKVDFRDIRGGEKRWNWIKKGVPVVVEIGANELANNSVTFSLRNNVAVRASLPLSEFVGSIPNILQTLQNDLLKSAQNFLRSNSTEIVDEKAFYDFFENDGGFAFGYWSEDAFFEQKIKNDLKVTARCLPASRSEMRGSCIFTKAPNSRMAVFAKAY